MKERPSIFLLTCDHRSSKGAGDSAASSNAAADGQVTLNSSWKYADFAKINPEQQSFTAVQLLKRRIGDRSERRSWHKRGNFCKDPVHPDGTAKVTGGTTGAGVLLQ